MAGPGFSQLFRKSSQVKIDPVNADRLRFVHLPDYARFLLENRLSELAAEQYRLIREMNIPLLGYFSHLSHGEQMEYARQGMQRLLQALSANHAAEYIEVSLQNWVNNKIPEITRNQVVPEDLSLLSFIRAKIFRDAIPFYTKDQHLSIQIMEEVSYFIATQDMISIKTMLHTQQELYEQAQEIAHIGNWSLDIRSNRRAWSNEIFRIYELEPVTDITDELVSLIHPDDNVMVRNQMRISRDTGKPHDFYYRILMKDGREKHLHARGQVLQNENGQAEKMFGTLQDVTVQKKFEKEHREYQYFIQKINDLTPSIVGVFHVKTGKFLFINKAIETMLGYSPAEVLERGFEFFSKIIHPEDLPRILSEHNRAVAEVNSRTDFNQPDEIQEFRYRMLHADGQWRWFHSFGAIFEKNAAHQIETVINVTMDVSEEINLHRKLRLNTEEMHKQEDRYTLDLEIKNRELEQKNKELESFSYIASHDLQEPVRKIRIWTNRIEETENMSETLKDSLAKIQKASIRMQKLIQGILQYSQTDMMYVPRERTDLNSVMDEVLLDLSEIIEERKIVIEKDLLPTISLVRIQFVQLFSNIISNSIKYSREDVPLKITISSATAFDYSVKPGSRVHLITIADNGIGFQQEYADKMFELFRRLESAPGYSGTGIGLAICKKIVTNHQGTIQARGIPGEGASFEISIPFTS